MTAAGTSPGLANHRPLRGFKSQQAKGGRCKGNDESFAIQKHRALGGLAPTDVFELQVRLGEHGTRPTKTQATSMVIALRQALAGRLGIECRELGFAVTQHTWDAEPTLALALFDTAAGGAGYAPRAGDDINALLLSIPCDPLIGTRDSAIQAAEEPGKPWRNIELSALSLFQLAVVVLALRHDLRGEAVEALGDVVGTRKGHIGDGTRNPAIAVLKGVNRDEPEVRNRADKYWVKHCAIAQGRLEPADELPHLGGQSFSVGRFKM